MRQTFAGRSGVLAVAAAGFAFLVPLAVAAEPGTSPLEQASGAAVSDVAGKPVQVRCHDQASWAASTSERGVPVETQGYAIYGGSIAELSPVTCAALDDLWTGSPPACTRWVPYTATVRQAEWVKVKRRVRVRVAGKLVWRMRTVRVRKLVSRKVERERTEPASCYSRNEWREAVLTLAHEGVHLTGIRDEATAECWAIQRTATVAERLGVPAADATALAVLAWAHYPLWAGTALWSAECRDGGALDLAPGDGIWP